MSGKLNVWNKKGIKYLGTQSLSSIGRKLNSLLCRPRFKYAHDANFGIKYGLSGCPCVFKPFGSFEAHIHRNHKNAASRHIVGLNEIICPECNHSGPLTSLREFSAHHRKNCQSYHCPILESDAKLQIFLHFGLTCTGNIDPYKFAIWNPNT